MVPCFLSYPPTWSIAIGSLVLSLALLLLARHLPASSFPQERFYEQLRAPSLYRSTPTPFSFELGCGERSFVFCAESEAQLHAWMHALRNLLNQRSWQRATLSPRHYLAANLLAPGDGGAAEGSTGVGARGAGVADRWGSTTALPGDSETNQILTTLEIGRHFTPVTDVAVWPVHSSLQQLHRFPAASADEAPSGVPPLLGICCDVSLRRAKYTLAVSSTVEIVNMTSSHIEVT